MAGLAGTAFSGETVSGLRTGDHYPQLQMQSGVTGINTIRIYNPVKNSQEHDPAACSSTVAARAKNIPSDLIHEPWKLSAIEQQMYRCVIGVDYPAPIVDLEQTRKYASDEIWGIRKSNTSVEEGTRILHKHVTPRKSAAKKKNEDFKQIPHA